MKIKGVLEEELTLNIHEILAQINLTCNPKTIVNHLKDKDEEWKPVQLTLSGREAYDFKTFCFCSESFE